MSEKKSDANLSARNKAIIVASWLTDKKARNLVALDVSTVSPICDAMVVASAANLRQAQALADHVLNRCGEEGFSYLGMEGYRNGQWVLLDLNDVMVHIFQEDLRAFYNVEGLWAEGRRIDLPLPPTEKSPA